MIVTKGQHWGIVGAGLTGCAAATWLMGQGASVLLVDDDAKKLDIAAGKLSGQISVRPTSAVLASDASGWVISPGVPPTHSLVSAILSRDAAYSDLDLWQSKRRSLTVAVTGTNGKSTVTRMLTELLARANFSVCEGGNIGTPVTELLAKPCDRTVLEVSSFQLYYSRHFAPEIGIVTNIFPDHLDWHASYVEYVNAKAKIAAHMTPEHTLIVASELGDFAGDTAARRMRVGPEPTCDVVALPAAIRYETRRGPVNIDLQSLRQHIAYPINAGFVAAVAACLSLPASILAESFAGYRSLPYRFAVVGEIDGVRYVNDSKATNLHATVSAVKNIAGPVRLLAGGKNKNLDWRSILADLTAQVKAVYAYGESQEQIKAAWVDKLPVGTFATLGDALKAAHAEAVAGETVLLAPGTSSFDQFSGYEERGRRFDLLVKALAGVQHG